MLVFVYGTLKKGFHNHQVMQQAGGIFIRNAITFPEYEMISFGAYPGLIHIEAPGNIIKGELYEVADIAPIDRLEGHPQFYERFLMPIAVEEVIEAWIYLLNPETYGDYEKHYGIRTHDNVKEWVGQ